MQIVGLVHDHQSPTRLAFGERARLRGLARDPFDDRLRALIGGVEFDRRPVHVGRERVGRRGLANAWRAVEDDGFPM